MSEIMNTSMNENTKIKYYKSLLFTRIALLLFKNIRLHCILNKGVKWSDNRLPKA